MHGWLIAGRLNLGQLEDREFLQLDTCSLALDFSLIRAERRRRAKIEKLPKGV